MEIHTHRFLRLLVFFWRGLSRILRGILRLSISGSQPLAIDLRHWPQIWRRASPALPTCSCPLALSGLGQLFASESLALNSGHLWWQFRPCVTRRTLSPHTAHDRRTFTGNVHFANSTEFTVVSLRVR